LALSGSGEALGQRAGATLLGAGDGLAALAVDGRVAVASTADLAKDRWSAEVGSAAAVPVLADGSGGLWVWSGDGFAAAATGQAVGFGQDAGDAGVRYQVLEGGIVVRVESNAGGEAQSVTRVDPATGQDLWDGAVRHTGPAAVVAADGRILTGGFEAVNCVDAETGEQRWSRPADRLIGPDGGNVLVGSADGRVSALKTSTGALEYQFDVGAVDFDRADFGLGAEILYLVGPDKLLAHRLEKDAAALWELPLPRSSADPPHRLVGAGGELWLVSGGDLRPIR
ncbi:MAG: PQQ-binding-like beta-propeller repeat protein, partial [Bifidobacteriaceae bacterium]|nr:PQQ-binding-like beta-propeller repeat protein [Bifidobacteriaceae bacterium]